VLYGSNLYRKDNPRWGISNAKETPRVPDLALLLPPAADCPWDRPSTGIGGRAANALGRARAACGICLAWLIGLPRRAGTRLHATDDAEARWWDWEVTERYGGLVRWYRDTRFAALRHNPGLRRNELCDLGSPDSVMPDCSSARDH
jgi:hypothetical protein